MQMTVKEYEFREDKEPRTTCSKLWLGVMWNHMLSLHRKNEKKYKTIKWCSEKKNCNITYEGSDILYF